MKVITITDENIKSVYGRLKKFFYNKNRTGFEEWHNFDCGFKKHISPYLDYLYIKEKKTRVVNRYPSPNSVTYEKKGTVPGISYDYILINLDAGHSIGFCAGDKIAFCGNRIITRTDCFWGYHKYIYAVFQATPIGKKEQKRMHDEAEFINELNEEILNNLID